MDKEPPEIQSSKSENFPSPARTEKRKSDEHLKLYQEIFSNSTDGIAIIDAKGVYIEQNAAHKKLIGYSDEDLKNQTPAIHLGEEVFASIAQELSKTGSFRGEAWSTTKDGRRVPIDLSAFAVKDRNNEVLCYVGIKRDITDKIKTQEGLKESEERFRQFAENIEEVFWMTDVSKSKILYVSPAYEKIWGRSCQSLYENPRAYMDSIHPEDRGRLIEALSKQLTGRFDEEYRIIQPDGNVRWIRDRAFRIKDLQGEIYRIAGIAEDITEIKEHEHKLNFLANITYNSIDAISATDSQSRITTWNRAAENIFGYKAQEVLGKDIYSTLVPPEKTKEIRQFFMRDPKAIVRFRTERLHKGGKRIPVTVTTFPIVDEKGLTYGRASIYQDLRHVVEMERKLMEQSRMAALGSMAASIAHEIRNPLFGISSVAQILSREATDKPEVQELGRSMHAEIERLNGMLRNLLIYSKPHILELSPSNPKTFFEEFLTLHEERIKESGVRFEAVFDPPDAQFFLDADQIRQVILNLCLNAIQASSPGKIVQISSKYETDNGWTFQINNGGTPISKVNLTKIFEPFFSTKSEGSGLGLSICKKIVDDHKGIITCESSEDKGTTFTIYIPNAQLDA